MYEYNGVVVANMISPLCLWLPREREGGLKTKTIESIAGGYWFDVRSAQENKL